MLELEKLEVEVKKEEEDVEKSSDSDDGSDDTVAIVNPEIQTPVNVKVVDLSDEESTVNSPPTEAGYNSRPRRSCTKHVNYKDDSDDEKARKDEMEALMSSTLYIHDTRRECLRRPLPPKVSNVVFTDPSMERNGVGVLTEFFRKNGHRLEYLSFKAINHHLLTKVALYCPNLTALSISEDEYMNNGYEASYNSSSSGESLSSSSVLRPFSFSKSLNKVCLAGSNPLLASRLKVSTILTSFPETIETIQVSFNRLEDVNRILEGIKGSQNLMDLKSLILEYRSKEGQDEQEHSGDLLCVRREQILQLTSMDLRCLCTLQLVCGIWDDIKPFDLESLLTKFAPTLRHFSIAGNLQGSDIADCQFKLRLPVMHELISFSMGSVYEFEDESAPDIRDTASASGGIENGEAVDESALSTELISIELEFPILPKLQSLSLGNLVVIESISPSLFPELKLLHIGSNWTLPLLPLIPTTPTHATPLPVFETVQDLQLPDCLENEFFVSRLKEMFPALKKVKMNLPSVRSLRHFINSMANSELEGLTLKTRYDFRGMLESALCACPYEILRTRNGPSSSTQTPVSIFGEPHEALMKLKNPQDGNRVFNAYVQRYNIELPIPLDDEILEADRGIGNLKNLRKLIICHVSRNPIPIPVNARLLHSHPDQRFLPRTRIGFVQYPIARKFFKHDLKGLKLLETFKHINFEIPCDYTLPNQVRYSGSNSVRYSDRRRENSIMEEDNFYWEDEAQFGIQDSIPRKRTNLKVKISRTVPSMKGPPVKKEKIEGLDMKPVKVELKP